MRKIIIKKNETIFVSFFMGGVYAISMYSSKLEL